MDSDIQFGEVEERAPERHLRPDRNKHFATVPCGAPSDEDLPIFIDLDVMRDMESHAISNTQVELGGVMLGGQYHDADGRPFVVVTDSLRATHYESTKGSFKFTHDTWSEITRQRDEFPEDLSMVGWYHTHPDWGVFLSGMDMFICDNFFNKPLDVALVIDPCRDDRGMFQWTGDPGERIRRTLGFYLISSRFRRDELEQFAFQLEGPLEMASDPRSRGFSSAPHMPPPVINIAESKNPWQAVAVLGMLSTQFFLLALIAWKLLLPAVATPPPPAGQNEIRAEREMLDRIIGDLQVAPDGLVTELAEQRRTNEELRAANLGLHAQITVLQESNRQAEQQLGGLVAKQGQLERDLTALREDNRQQRDRIQSLEQELELTETPAGPRDWTLYVVGGLLVVLLGAGIAVALGMRNPAANQRPTDEAEQPPRGAQGEQDESDSAAKPPRDGPSAGPESAGPESARQESEESPPPSE